MSRAHSFSTRDPAAPVMPPPAIAGLTGLVAYVVDRVIGRKRILPRWIRPLGVGAIAAGLGLSVWGILHFKKRDVSPSPWHRPSGFVSDGPYAISRNPMYAGSALILLGIGLVRGSIPTLLSPLAFVTILSRGQIAFEEAALQNAYGSEYENYKQHVRRWF
jgi:protein-S-isoprenylcysteine O-methyltransferase Ste14